MARLGVQSRLHGNDGDSASDRLRLSLVAEVTELHALGLSPLALARAFRCHPETVRYVIQGRKVDFSLLEAHWIERGIRELRAELEAAA